MAPVDLVGLESFESHRRVAVIVVLNFIEIALPDIHRQVFAPIVLDPLIDDGAPGREFLNAIATAADRPSPNSSRTIPPAPPLVPPHSPTPPQSPQIAPHLSHVPTSPA